MILAFRSAAALAAAAFALTACGGGASQPTNQIPTTASLPGNGTGLSTAANTIAGVGDSLTAGEQNSGLTGALLPGPLGTNAQVGVIAPNGVQATQEHGFFALLWQQANGYTAAQMSNPATSPLPLMTPPGLGGLLAPTSSGFPAAVASQCTGAQVAANAFSTALSLRENPSSTPYDVGVPGQIVHEALYMTGPIGDCTVSSTNSAAQIVQLNALVNGESQYFLPIMASFGSGVTQMQAAIRLHAKFATLYLGSNDLLKIAFSNGGAPVTAPQSVHDDIKTMIQQLQGAGSKVLVANLVDVMGAATFIPQSKYAATLQTYITGALIAQGLPAATASAAATPYANAYAAQEIAAAGLGGNGYFTINALFATLATAAAQIAAHAAPVAPALPSTGDYVTDAVAANVKALNAAYNGSISAAASETGAALVDVAATFAAAEAAGGIPVNPPKCCSLVYRGGFFSLDGLHPSNTGYALIANTFIDTMNAKYGTSVPDVSIAAVYATDPYAPGNGVSGFDVLRKAQ